MLPSEQKFVQDAEAGELLLRDLLKELTLGVIPQSKLLQLLPPPFRNPLSVCFCSIFQNVPTQIAGNLASESFGEALWALAGLNFHLFDLHNFLLCGRSS